jgi:hypothetical protein
MLTVIALVQRYRAQLPERRAELYEEAIKVLLSLYCVLYIWRYRIRRGQTSN